MTPYEIELARALWRCSHVPATSKKRFCRNMADIAAHKPEHEISMRQRYYMECLAWYYRRQMPKHLIPDGKPPLPLPKPIKPTSRRKVVIHDNANDPEFPLC